MGSAAKKLEADMSSQLEAENAELRARCEKLEAENAELRQRCNDSLTDAARSGDLT